MLLFSLPGSAFSGISSATILSIRNAFNCYYNIFRRRALSHDNVFKPETQCFFSYSFTECSSMECGNITPRDQSRNRMFVRECIEAFCPLRKVSIGIPLRMRAPKGGFTQQI